MIISITGEVGPDTLEGLIKAYNDITEKDTLEIYLNSLGGSVASAEAIIHLINKNNDRTTIIAYGEISSAAFDIFFRATCDKFILRDTYSRIHNIVNTQDFEKMPIPWVKEYNEASAKFFEKLGIKKSEILKIKKGQEVYLTFDRLIEMLRANG